MSFKREGDDQSQLNILKKRRVADLLSNFIPEDEATLLKNGRYTCLVCSHRPVFDTVDMLTVHRKGKRHLEGMKWFYGKKTELRHEIDKRRHQEYVKTENHQQEPASASPLLAQTRHITHHALLKAAPYSSCHKKRTRPDDPSADGGSGFSSPHINDRHLPQSHAAHTVGAKGTGATCPSLSCSENTPASPTPPQENRKKETKKKGLKSTGHTESEPLTEQRRRELEHYLRLKSSGWLQDKSGKWVKDENVEFDSDEDEPAPLGPSSESAEGTQ